MISGFIRLLGFSLIILVLLSLDSVYRQRILPELAFSWREENAMLPTVVSLHRTDLVHPIFTTEWVMPKSNSTKSVEELIEKRVVVNTRPPKVIRNRTIERRGMVRKYAKELFKPTIDTDTYLFDYLKTIRKHRLLPPRSDFIPAKSKPETALFYNVYLPNDTYAKVFEKIIGNQLTRIGGSMYKDSPFYYNIIGHDYGVDLCMGTSLSNCQKLRYMESGNERDTLTDLYDYCRERPQDNVIYLHDKGSFNMNLGNLKVMRVATTTAVSNECANMSSIGCNVCGMVLEPLGYLHSSGNMWRASCEYVNKLLPPGEYEEKRVEMQIFLKTNETASNLFDCYKDSVLECPTRETEYSKRLGIGRYAYEGWVFSHPDVHPCWALEGILGDVELFGKKPFAMRLQSVMEPVKRVLAGNNKLEFFKRGGKLFQFDYLYNKLPPNSSHFWTLWKKHVNPSRTPIHEPCSCVIDLL